MSNVSKTPSVNEIVSAIGKAIGTTYGDQIKKFGGSPDTEEGQSIICTFENYADSTEKALIELFGAQYDPCIFEDACNNAAHSASELSLSQWSDPVDPYTELIRILTA